MGQYPCYQTTMVQLVPSREKKEVDDDEEEEDREEEEANDDDDGAQRTKGWWVGGVKKKLQARQGLVFVFDSVCVPFLFLF